MADFKTALIALSNGEIAYEIIEENIGKILNRNPALAIEILEQLQDAFNAAIIDAEEFAKFKSYVTQLSARENPEVTIAHEARAAIGTSGDIDLALDFDLSPVTENPARRGHEKASTDTSWPDDKAAKHKRAKAEKIELGTVIRGRFKLDKVLGVGGMGTVFRGRDLIKVEARDKNPYVAIKILNEDFKDHPDGFIALQREASRQQKLAHPNIATVYDFDRTEEGTFFLTMELLEGEPLNKFIKKVVKPQRGLPFDQAFPMIEGLANALTYAHERDIVHSDFKPGNCFITKDGTMKVLDFGIARAVKAPGQGDTTDKTIFDPGKLGALTPPYASVEMLEELEPDTRDDIYALACVAYELLTGKHPFNKLRATTARDNNLVPIPIKGLRKSQIKALNRGLGFTREERSQTVKEFIDELRGTSSHFANPWLTLPSVAVILAAIGIFPLIGLMHEREIDRLVGALRSGEPVLIDQTLSQLRNNTFDEKTRDRVLVTARDDILAYYDEKIATRVNVPANQVNFAAAHALVDELSEFSLFSDSTQVASWKQRLRKSKSDLLNRQSNHFNEAILSGRLLELDEQEDVHDILREVEKLDPELARHFRLRLPGAYSAAIQRAIVNEEFERAVALSQAGLKIAPQNAYLKNLSYEISGAQERAQLRGELDNIRNHIRDTLAIATQLSDFYDIQEQVQKLAFFEPNAKVLPSLRDAVANFVKNSAADSLDYNDYSLLFKSLDMSEIADAQRAKRLNIDEQIDHLLATLRANVLSANTTIHSPAVTQLVTELTQYPAQRPSRQDALYMTAHWVINQARRARSLGNFSDALGDLEKLGQVMGGYIPLPELSDEKQIIAALMNDNAVQYVQNSEAQTAQFDRQSAELRAQLAAAPISDANLATVLDNYDALIATDPASARLSKFRRDIIEKTHVAVHRAQTDGDHRLVRSLLSRLIRYFPDDQTTFEMLVASKDDAQQADIADLNAYKAELQSLLSDPSVERRWSHQVQQAVLRLRQLLDPSDEWIQINEDKIAEFFIAAATRARTEQEFALSDILLWRAQPYTDDPELIAEQRAALTAAENDFTLQHQMQDRDARIVGLNHDFATQLQAMDLRGATQTFNSLKRELGAENTAELSTASDQLAAAYLSFAEQEIARDNTALAREILQAGTRALPDNAKIGALFAQQQVAIHQRALAEAFSEDNNYDLQRIFDRLQEIKELAPQTFVANRSAWAKKVAQSLQRPSTKNALERHGEIARAKEIFPTDLLIQDLAAPSQLIEDGMSLSSRIRAMQDRKLLSQSRLLLDELSPEQQSNSAFKLLFERQDALTGRAREHFSRYKKALETNDAKTAADEINAALDIWRDNQTFIEESAKWRLEDASEIEAASLEQAVNDSKCTRELAGLGKRLSGICFDMLSSDTRGPLLVVIPAEDSSRGAFAIGKFEVTVEEFNAFCKQASACDVDTQSRRNLPRSNVSKDDIDQYLAWLSAETKVSYRLPSIAEWRFAATADGQQADEDVNCHNPEQSQTLLDQSVKTIDYGTANGWGIYNYLGNVQELATENGKLFALGGSYSDDIENCTINFQTPHLGTPDLTTGFRVLRQF